jgi:gluconolactonase
MGTYDILDPRFRKLIAGHEDLVKLADGCRWSEGPVWFGAGRYLVWSDIPNDRMMRFDETDGSVSVFRAPSNHANGNTVDREGRMVSCEHSGRRVTRTEHDGSISVMADRFEGKRLNSPNDVVVKSDGSVWFSDPSYGIDSDYEGRAAESEIGACNVYRVDPSGTVSAVATDRVRPNGLAFSPDESLLYVADTGFTHVPGLPRTIHAYPVTGDTLGAPRLFATLATGASDGFRVDVQGNVWTSAGSNIFCYAPDGTHLGCIAVPETVANLCFGGPRRNRLFIAARTSLYSVHLQVRGL